MSLKLPEQPGHAPEAPDGERSRSQVAGRAWLTLLVVSIVAVVLAGLVVFSWMVNETHFDRPSPEFDQLEAEIEKLPGVDSVDKERWVEAPTFSDPTSWMSVAVDSAGLPGLTEAACSTDYPDAVTWTIRVRTPTSATVVLNAVPSPATLGEGSGCPGFGFDAAGLVAELDRVVPGQTIQPTIWEDGRLTLVALEPDTLEGYGHLLPLIEHADDLLAAAGLDADDLVEVNAATLGMTLQAGESAEYVALLTALAERHGATSFWEDGSGTPTDGVQKVQVVAPEQQRAEIERVIRSSGLRVADLSVRFVEQ